jgi:hypothetical protein
MPAMSLEALPAAPALPLEMGGGTAMPGPASLPQDQARHAHARVARHALAALGVVAGAWVSIVVVSLMGIAGFAPAGAAKGGSRSPRW